MTLRKSFNFLGFLFPHLGSGQGHGSLQGWTQAKWSLDL